MAPVPSEQQVGDPREKEAILGDVRPATVAKEAMSATCQLKYIATPRSLHVGLY